MNFLRLLACALIALSALGPLAARPALAGHDELIPRKVLFGNPERTAPMLSPDGTQIAFTAPVDGVMNIWVGPVDDLEKARPVTKEKTRPVKVYKWVRNGTHLVYLQDQRGNENYHLYAVDLANDTIKDLTPYKAVRAEIAALSYARPDEVLVGLNNRDARWHDAWIINVVTGKSEMALKNDGFSSLIVDNTLTVRLASKPRADGGDDYLIRDGAEWKPFISVPSDDAMTTQLFSFSRDQASLYMLDSRGRDKSALTLLNLKSKAATVLAESDKSDIAYVISDPVTEEVLAYSSEYQRMDWKALDPALKADLKFLDRQVAGYWTLLSQSKDNNLWTLWIDNISEPIKFGLYDRKKRTLKTLFAARPSLEGARLPSIRPRVIKARDGLDLVSYLTLPKGSDADGDGVPDKPLPLVLMPHGGPWARDSYAYNPWGAWLADRGYATLTVNFRGSTGFGKAFVNAGDKEWGGKMHDDLIDAVDWAVASGVARKDKVAIFGASYGGYAALVGLTFTPTKFACAIDIVGPSNLKTFLTNTPPYWTSFFNTFKRRVGDPTTPEGKKLLRDRSPLFRVGKIQRPLLIGQGANDPRVKQSEATQIVRAMTKKGLPVTYAFYADEGHGFSRPENRLSFYAISEAFLSQCLGGRHEPIGDDFEGASIAVPTGKEHIPGLKEALAAP
jgi:dipeptidyl aminopeptidase/acylaminoacyl peptidase